MASCSALCASRFFLSSSKIFLFSSSWALCLSSSSLWRLSLSSFSFLALALSLRTLSVYAIFSLS